MSEEPTKDIQANAFLAWPAPGDLRFGLLLSLAFFIFFELTYVATNYLTWLHPFRIHVHSSAELSIPFVPSMALVYISLNLLLALAPFVLRTWREIIPLCVVMTLETLTCALLFLLLPVELGYARQIDDGMWGRFCANVSALSLRFNNLPSLHVAFAFTAGIAFGERCGAVGRWLFLLWATLIAASTLLIHEHHLADVAAGIVLALMMQRVYRWSAGAPRLDALHLEFACLTEFRHFVMRHRRYLLTLIVIYRYSLGRWRRTQIIRAGYALTQHVDDVLDGDRRIDGDPEVYVRGLLRQDDTSRMSLLAKFVLTELQESGGDRDLACLFDLLSFDYRRRLERLLLSSEELRAHHRLTFFYSLNLTLIACGVELRAGDAAELISALAWCSTMRDLEEDFRKGLINIPAAVMEQSASEGSNMEYTQLIRTAAMRSWIRAEYTRGMDAIEQCNARLNEMGPREGVSILRLFLRAIQHYARKYTRQNRDILSADTTVSLREMEGDGSCRSNL